MTRPDTDWQPFDGNPRVTSRWYRGKFLMVNANNSLIDYAVLDGEPDGQPNRASGFVRGSVLEARQAAESAVADVIDFDETREHYRIHGAPKLGQPFDLGGEA